MIHHKITDQEYAAALKAGRKEAETEFRASSVRYVPERDAIEIITTRGAGFLIPKQWIDTLKNVHPEDLAQMEAWLDGTAIEIDALDIHISVHGLLTQSLPAMLPARALAGLFASRGGKATSETKRATARSNGRKGGRPRKPANPEAA